MQAAVERAIRSFRSSQQTPDRAGAANGDEQEAAGLAVQLLANYRDQLALRGRSDAQRQD